MQPKTKMGDLVRVTCGDGKYTVVQTHQGKVRLYRHGDPWPAGEDAHLGSGLVLALAYDLAATKEKLEDLKKSIIRIDKTCWHRLQREGFV